MTRKEKAINSEKSPRQSVTFTPEIYAELERLSREKKVSIAWVVREATEKYIAAQEPLPLFQKIRYDNIK